jgi:hypothetical protein
MKSRTMMPSACAVRISCDAGPSRRGGDRCQTVKISLTVVVSVGCPGRTGSPWIRRQPRHGFLWVGSGRCPVCPRAGEPGVHRIVAERVGERPDACFVREFRGTRVTHRQLCVLAGRLASRKPESPVCRLMPGPPPDAYRRLADQLSPTGTSRGRGANPVTTETAVSEPRPRSRPSHGPARDAADTARGIHTRRLDVGRSLLGPSRWRHDRVRCRTPRWDEVGSNPVGDSVVAP